MQDTRTHIIHERTPNARRTIGYRVTSHENRLEFIAAEARCHPNDNFNKRVARSIVETRLKSAVETGKYHRVFTGQIANVKMPTTASEWREVEQTILGLAEYRLQPPAALS